MSDDGLMRMTGGCVGHSETMDDNTMSLTIYAAPGTRAEFIVDEATKRITLDLKHHPKPAQAIAIPEPLAAPLVNLALHRTDLWRAREFLDEFDRQGGVQPPERIVQQGNRMSSVLRALWLAALGSTMKCFQHSQSRSASLDPETIFGSDTTQGIRATFDLLKNLRNKHVLHDENDWMQAIPVAIVGAPGYEPVVSDIDCLVMEGTDTAHIGQLGAVVDAALAWVNQEIHALIEMIRADLLARSYDDLIALPGPAAGSTPYTGSIGQRRR
jgi:hypothetical protein